MSQFYNTTRHIKVWITVCTVLFAASCKKNNISGVANMHVYFQNTVGGAPVAFNSINYTNASGNKYSISLLKYYISHFTLISREGTERDFRNYKLINAADSASGTFSLTNVPNGTYDSVRFYLGVDSIHNHTGAQEGDLDPMYGMIWSWNTGYIFFKHEGSFIDANGQAQPLEYHLGTDNALATVTLPLNGCLVEGKDLSLYINFDLNKLYNTPIVINFNGNNLHQSTDAADAMWIRDMRYNFPSAFSFVKVQ